MNIQQLRSFVEIAESGSLSKASDKLRIAQSALSRQVKLLEAGLGQELFQRFSRGMQLTEAGEVLFSRVSGLLIQIERSIDDVRSLNAAPKGHVALGMMPSVSVILASRVAIRVARELPDVSLRIVEGYGGHLIDWLHRGDVDLSLLYGPATDLHLRVRELMQEELVLIGPKDAKFSQTAPFPVSRIGELELVLPSRPHGLRAVVETAAAKAGAKLRVMFEADSFTVLKELVGAGLGCTVLPLSALAREPRTASFRMASLTGPKITRQILLGLPSSRTDTRATKAVAALMLEEIGLLIESGAWRARPGAGLRDFDLH